MTVLGIGVFVINARYVGEFQAYSREVAREKGGADSLDASHGGNDGGFNGYQERLDHDIQHGRVDSSLSEGLQQRALRLQASRARVFGMTAAYVVALIVFGLTLR